jgi:membrane protease YdiL (CAAX protease family)
MARGDSEVGPVGLGGKNADAVAARDEARTPWPAWAAVPIAVAILTVAAAAGRTFAEFVVTLGSSAHPAAGGDAGSQGGTGTAGGLPYASLLALAVTQTCIVVSVLAVARLRGPWRETLGLDSPARAVGPALLAALALLVVALPLSLAASKLLGLDPFADLRGFVPTARAAHGWLLVLVAGLGAPLAEEILFRGFLLTALARSRLGFPVALLLTTAAWTWLHWPYTAAGLAAVFAVGLYLGWLYRRTGSLWVAIGCHALYNLALVITIRYVDLPPPP